MDINFRDFQVISGGVCAARGFKASGIRAGIRQNKGKLDLGLILCEDECTAAAVYTKNKVYGAPIAITKKHLSDGKIRGVIVNSGNANTCNSDGEEKALKMCSLAAKATGVKPEDFIVASTGVIGEAFDISPIERSMDELASKLSKDGGKDIATAIMTTDTVEKIYSIKFNLDGKECVIGGIAKGSGMIHPNMATMLCFITTDVNITSSMLDKALRLANDKTFNMVSVDGDTSTNDMVSVMASGKSENALIDSYDDNFDIFTAALYKVMEYLAKNIAKDGEGANKLIECVVSHANTEEIAKSVAKTVITSSLVKTAICGADANWGRILCAIGYAEGDFPVSKIDVKLASRTKSVLVCKNGVGVDFSEDQARIILWGDEVRILIDMRDGQHSATAWGCDLTYEYVKINGEYRT